MARADIAKRTPPLYRLVYFNVRGIVEPIRLLLALAQADFEDVRYPMRAASAGFAPDESYWRDKARGSFAANMNALPILQVLDSDGIVIAQVGQSQAILRYVARHHNFCGATPLEDAFIDAICEHVRDIKQSWYTCKQEASHNAQRAKAIVCCGCDAAQDEEEDAKSEWLGRELPNKLVALEAALPPPQEGPWLVGTTVSLADIVIYHILSTPQSIISGCIVSFFDGDSDRVRSALGVAPRLRYSVSAVANIEQIKFWEDHRPDTFS